MHHLYTYISSVPPGGPLGDLPSVSLSNKKFLVAPQGRVAKPLVSPLMPAPQGSPQIFLGKPLGTASGSFCGADALPEDRPTVSKYKYTQPIQYWLAVSRKCTSEKMFILTSIELLPVKKY